MRSRGYTAAAMIAGRIGVLAGGESPEREISLRSGEHVHGALVARGHDAQLLTLERLDDLVTSLDGIDIVFNCLHGGAGEDGTVQLALDLLGLPYTGSGPRAAARSMDKIRSRNLFATHGLAVPAAVVWTGQPVEEFASAVEEALSFPVIVKPPDGGSSLGVEFIDAAEKLVPTLHRATKEHGAVLVERFVPGREITVGILDVAGETRALPVIEIRPSERFFTYESKCDHGLSEFVVPASLDEGLSEEVQGVALEAHEALGCRGYSRVDLRLDEDGTPFVLEVNALPGMTAGSDLPRAAAAAGIDFEDLVEAMLATAAKEEE